MTEDTMPVREAQFPVDYHYPVCHGDEERFAVCCSCLVIWPCDIALYYALATPQTPEQIRKRAYYQLEILLPDF